MNIEAYCVKCKATREVRDPRKISMKNGRFAAKGPCVVCGTTMFKILSKECAEKMGDMPSEASAAEEQSTTESKPE